MEIFPHRLLSQHPGNRRVSGHLRSFAGGESSVIPPAPGSATLEEEFHRPAVAAFGREVENTRVSRMTDIRTGLQERPLGSAPKLSKVSTMGLTPKRTASRSGAGHHLDRGQTRQGLRFVAANRLEQGFGLVFQVDTDEVFEVDFCPARGPAAASAR